MDAVAVQRKENTAPAKSAVTSTPDSQTDAETRTETAVGLPLFLTGATRQAAAAPPSPPDSPRGLRRQAGTEETDGPVSGKHADIQRQPAEEEEEEEEEEEAIQPKLTIGQPNDEYEQQADRVAERVMRAPLAASRQRVDTTVTPLYVQRLCASCEEELQQQPSTQRVQSKSTESQSTEPKTPAPTRTLSEALRSPGRGAALPDRVQTPVSRVLGSDLSDVRVHSDEKAQQAARSINAKAFTHGNHIYLGKGESEHDVPLMAHEATHVVQQGAAPNIAPEMRGEEGMEHEEAVAESPEHESGEVETESKAPETEARQEESQPEETAEAEAAAPEASPAEQESEAQREGEPAEEEISAAQGAQGAQAGEVETAAAGAEGESGEAETEAGAGAGAGPSSNRPGEDAVATETMTRISAAPDSLFKSHVTAQAELINNDSLITEILITELAEQRRQQVSLQFSAARSGMVGFVEGHIALAQEVIAAKQEEVIAATENAFATAQAVVASTMAAIEAQGAMIAAVINSIVESAAATVQATVSGIAGQITGLINSIPLPDLPGVAQIRRAAVNMVNSAAGMVNNSLNLVLNMIRRTLSGGMRLLNSFLQIFRRMIDRTLALMSRTINRITQMVMRTLDRVLSVIVSTLRRVMYGIIVPILVRVENSVTRAITEQEQQALLDVRTNRREHLAALAGALSPEGGEEAGGAAVATTSVDDWIISVMEIGRSARDANRMILLSFLEQTSGFVALFITTLRSVIALIIQAIMVRVAQMITSLIGMVARFLQEITQMMATVISFLQGLIARFIETVMRVVEFVRNAVQRPIDWVIDHAGRTLARIRDAVNRFVGRLFGGGEASPAEMPLPAPPIPAPPIPAPPIPAPPIPAPPVPVPAPPVPAPTPVPAPPVVVIVIIVIIVLIILLILLYLLYKWLKRKLRKPPKPKPPPCSITTRTLVSAPDGSPDTRSTVGVCEEVEMTCSVPATWAASSGRVRPAGPNSITWTAPNVGPVSTVTATPASGSPCLVAMAVIPPSANHQVVSSNQTYTAGLAGSGFIGDATVIPTTVSFSRIEIQEQVVNATATGYYDTELGWNGDRHPLGAWISVDANNNAGTDTVGTVPPGTNGTFSRGTFTWPIPQHYHEVGGGAGIFYSTGTHVQDMTGPTGEETTSKEGASRTRSP